MMRIKCLRDVWIQARRQSVRTVPTPPGPAPLFNHPPGLIYAFIRSGLSRADIHRAWELTVIGVWRMEPLVPWEGNPWMSEVMKLELYSNTCAASIGNSN